MKESHVIVGQLLAAVSPNRLPLCLLPWAIYCQNYPETLIILFKNVIQAANSYSKSVLHPLECAVIFVFKV